MSPSFFSHFQFHPPSARYSSLHDQQMSKITTTSVHILLTGSTGNMGAYILHNLLLSPIVTQVICLNRSPDAASRQLLNHEARGLDESAHLLRSRDPRVSFLTVDLSQPTLGLRPNEHLELTRMATHILHNAWPVSFNLAFSSFLPSIQGVQNLIDFALQCTQQCSFTFISSVSVVGRWAALPGWTASVPEVPLEDWRTAKMGYGQSKLVSERILAKASEACGLRTTIIRVGQVAGPVERGGKGSWNKWEWIPSLVKSSGYLEKVPETLGPMEDVDWIPVDMLGAVIGELVLAAARMNEDGQSAETEEKGGSMRKRARLPRVLERSSKTPNVSANGLLTVYHAANPHRMSYTGVLLPIIIGHLEASTGKQVQRVSFSEWVAALEKSSAQQASDPEENPASKLLTFFKDLQDKAIRFPDAKTALLETRESCRVSESLRHCQGVREEWMEMWLEQWGL